MLRWGAAEGCGGRGKWEGAERGKGREPGEVKGVNRP